MTLENFKSKESITIATEEMRQSTVLLQDLHEKLQSATEELSAINNDERLLEWPVTEAPDLPRLIQLIEPYHQLWHVAYKFHQSHDVWYHGNKSLGTRSIDQLRPRPPLNSLTLA